MKHLARKVPVLLLAGVAAGGLAWGAYGDAPPAYPDTGVFTPARATLGEAVRDFFGRRPAPVQPIDFPHNVHAAQKVKCTEYCHEGVTKGPTAGLPSVKACMICHEAIATDKPLIQRITKLQEDGRDLAWQRVYGYTAQAHVRFNHAPHVRAKVDCAECHGNVAEQTVAQRVVNQSMGWCVNCHMEKKASNDCMTCHY